MAKTRVHDLAKEYGMSSKEMLEHLADMKIPAKSASSTLEDAYVSIVRKKQDSVCVLFQLPGFLQICRAGGSMGGIAVQLGQCYHQNAGSLCQLMQGNGNAGDLLIPVLGLAVCQQLQIVDINGLRLHPLCLCLYPSNALAGR